MKEMENYLWDKSGEDAEIAELENALAAFRYKETAPPALPAKILPFQTKEARETAAETSRRFSFRFALAACAATVLITFGVLFQFSGGKTTTKNDPAQTTSINEESIKETAGENDDEVQTNSVAESENLTLANVETSPQIEVSRQIIKQFEKTLALSKPKVVKIRRSVSSENKTNVQNPEIKNPTPSAETLTAEEKHAYDQLMLALSVTSRQLRIVKDKVDGIEDPTNRSANER